jgi:sugar phosphate isomerase/epimerase
MMAARTRNKAIEYDDRVMLTRRNFLSYSAAALPAMALLGPRLWAVDHLPLGVQLYTVRKQAETDLPKVLQQIHEIGYEEIETFGNVYTHPAPELRRMIHDAGLRVPSGHFNYDGLSDKFEYAKQLGVEWMVCPMLTKALWNSLDGFRTAARQFNQWGKRAKDMGMRFAFHNHDYEFQTFGGKQTGYEVLVSETDPSLVSFEMDCYWVAQAGLDPLQLLHRLGSRVRMLHLKDRKAGFPPSHDMGPSSAHFTEVGHGSIQWKPILSAARDLGVKHYFVEQDESDQNPVTSIAESYKYLRTIVS